MMKVPSRRCERLNSLLREVISEVILRETQNPNISPFTSVTHVEIAPDLKFAKVFISVLGDEKEQEKTLSALNASKGYIGSHSSKKVRIRYFPTLSFFLDHSVEKHMKIEKVLQELEEKRKKNPPKIQNS